MVLATNVWKDIRAVFIAKISDVDLAEIKREWGRAGAIVPISHNHEPTIINGKRRDFVLSVGRGNCIVDAV